MTPTRFALAVLLAAGCGTTRSTDTSRTATEQLLISASIDKTVSDLDFRGLAGQPVYLEEKYLDGVTDKGYLISSVRQQLLAADCRLMEDRAKATFVVEARSGGVGTDRNDLLVGVPQTTMPTVAGFGGTIPEIALMKKTDRKGVAKVAVFAYNRVTGQPIWQSGTKEAKSTSNDAWVLGTGPWQNGSGHDGVEFAGAQLVPSFGTTPPPPESKPTPTTVPASFNTPTAAPVPPDVVPASATKPAK